MRPLVDSCTPEEPEILQVGFAVDPVGGAEWIAGTKGEFAFDRANAGAFVPFDDDPIDECLLTFGDLEQQVGGAEFVVQREVWQRHSDALEAEVAIVGLDAGDPARDTAPRERASLCDADQFTQLWLSDGGGALEGDRANDRLRSRFNLDGDLYLCRIRWSFRS